MAEEEQQEQHGGAEQEEQRLQETLKLYFEFFKHFTTLSVAAAVVFLAIYKEGMADQWLVLLSLLAFWFVVVLAVPGMLLVIIQFRASSFPLQATDWLLISINMLFTAGLLLVLNAVFGITFWLLLVLMAVPIIEGLLIASIASGLSVQSVLKDILIDTLGEARRRPRRSALILILSAVSALLFILISYRLLGNLPS